MASFCSAVSPSMMVFCQAFDDAASYGTPEVRPLTVLSIFMSLERHFAWVFECSSPLRHNLFISITITNVGAVPSFSFRALRLHQPVRLFCPGEAQPRKPSLKRAVDVVLQEGSKHSTSQSSRTPNIQVIVRLINRKPLPLFAHVA